MKYLILICLLISGCEHIKSRGPEAACAKYYEQDSKEWYECVQREKISRNIILNNSLQIQRNINNQSN